MISEREKAKIEVFMKMIHLIFLLFTILLVPLISISKEIEENNKRFTFVNS